MLPPVIWIVVRHGLAWCAVAILVDQGLMPGMTWARPGTTIAVASVVRKPNSTG